MKKNTFTNIIGSSDSVSIQSENNSKIWADNRMSPLKIATYGDSTAVYGDTQSPANNDTKIATAPMPGVGATTLSRFFDKCALPLLYPMAELVQNCGVSGRTCATMISDETIVSTISTRKVIDADNQSPDVIIFRGVSVNDFDSAVYPLTQVAYDTIVNNYKLVLSRIMATGAFVIASGIFGWSKGRPGYPADVDGDNTRAAIMRIDADIKGYVENLNMPSQIVYLSSVGINCDSTGAFLPGHTLLSDGVHLSAIGGLARAVEEKNILEAAFGKSRTYLRIGKNLVLNPLFATNGTGGTGVTATGFTWTNTVNCARQNGKIEIINGQSWSTMELLTTATGSTGVDMIMPYNPTAGGTTPLNIAINDLYGFEVDYMLQNMSTNSIMHLTTLYMRVQTYDVTNSFRVIMEEKFNNTTDIGSLIPGGLNIHFSTPIIKFQEAAAAYGTSSTWIITMACDSVAGQVLKVGISNPRIVKL